MKLTERVKLKAAPRQSEEDVEDCHRFVSFFPTFVWAVRDFTLQLEVDGREISEDQYLENALRLRAGKGRLLRCWGHPALPPAASGCCSAPAPARRTGSVCPDC